MIKRVFPLLGLVLLCLSCKSAPAPSISEPMEYGGEAEGPSLPDPRGSGFAGEEPEASDIPSLVEPFPEPEMDQGEEAFLEPPPELGEASFPEDPPAEGEISAVLPDPFPEEPPPALSGDGSSEQAEYPPDPSDTISDRASGESSDTSPVPPPPFLGPAEPETPPVPAREPLPVPVNPVPDLPARVPPVSAGREEAVTYSRTLRALTGQVIEVPFRGTGWVYLGEEDAKRGISYTTRRLDAEGQSFIFRADAAGTYGLQFYRQDFIRDYIINDHVRLIIEDGPAVSAGFPPPDRGRVIAEPRWPELPGLEPSASTGAASTGSVPAEGAAPAGAASTEAASTGGVPAEGTAPDEAASAGGAEGPVSLRPVIRDEGIVPVAPAAVVTPRGAAPEGMAELPPESLPEDYMARARREYEAGRVREALAVLEQFRERFPLGSDEAWWLYGQVLEADSPVRDIRSALDYYRRLVREYPQSPRYAAARQRIAYLERYYFNIR